MGQPRRASSVGTEDIWARVGRRVGESRTAQGITAPVLAARLGCAVEWLLALEQGECPLLLDEGYAVAQALGMAVEQLLVPDGECPTRQPPLRTDQTAALVRLLGALRAMAMPPTAPPTPR